jgi:DNA-binding response OmpR family regulator
MSIVDLRHQFVILDGHAVVLTRQEYLLLVMLVHTGEIVPRAILLTQVFGYALEARTRTLDVHIPRMRRS